MSGNTGRIYSWGGVSRPYLTKLSTRRLKHTAGKRKVKIRETMRGLTQIDEKGFFFTDNLTGFAEVIGYLKSNQIPYEIIDGGKEWKYAIRRTDR